MCKKAMSILLSVILVLTVFTVIPLTASAEISGDFEYQVIDGEAEITDYHGGGYTLVIPAEIDGYTVTRIGDFAFWYKNFDTVEIPSTVTYIGSYAFYCNYDLSSIDIPDSVVFIGEYAFGYVEDYDSGQPTQRDIWISGGLGSEAQRYADENGFDFSAICGDYSLDILDDGTASVYYNGDETDLNVPNEIAGYTVTEFRGCGETVKSVKLPESVTEFSGGCSLENIYVNENNIVYSSIDGVLYNKEKTKIVCYPQSRKGTFVVPDTVSDISGAFFNCTGLSSVTLPDGLKEIGQMTFYQCENLKSVVIPDTVSVIGMGVFNGCTSLESVKLPNGLSELSANLFLSCESLKNVEIPQSVIKIGRNAFGSCTSLESIVIPDGVEELPYGCFAGCDSLKKVVLGNKVKTIDKWAIDSSALEEISFPDTLQFVGSGSLFGGCPWYDKQPDGVIYAGKLALVYKGDCPAKVEIKTGTRAINRSCFYDCKKLESITIPDSVEHIGAYAFYGCENLKSVTVPKSVAEIEEYALGYTYETVYDEETDDTYDTDVRIDGFVIYGYNDTEAERYAEENEISFVALEESEALLGDTDSDGIITIIDATYIQRYLAELPVLNFCAELADVSGDGIDITDATYIQRWIAEIEIPYPVGEPINKT